MLLLLLGMQEVVACIVAVENIFIFYVITLGIIAEFKRRKTSTIQ